MTIGYCMKFSLILILFLTQACIQNKDGSSSSDSGKVKYKMIDHGDQDFSQASPTLNLNTVKKSDKFQLIISGAQDESNLVHLQKVILHLSDCFDCTRSTLSQVEKSFDGPVEIGNSALVMEFDLPAKLYVKKIEFFVPFPHLAPKEFFLSVDEISIYSGRNLSFKRIDYWNNKSSIFAISNLSCS